MLLQALLPRFNDEEKIVQESALKTVGAVTACIKKESMAGHLTYVKNTLESLKEQLSKNKQKLLPGDLGDKLANGMKGSVCQKD